MAELILTEEERNAALWSDLDDAALGKLVKRKIALLTSSAEQLDRVTSFAAAMLLCCSAAENGAAELSMDIAGLTQGDRDFGSWRVSATRTDAESEPEPMVTKEAINDVMTGILSRSDEELLACSADDLPARYWYFRWDSKASLNWNIYKFSDALEGYKRNCRRWEEHHNGSSCVVERVREKYLMPKIREVISVLRVHLGDGGEQ